MTEAEAMAVVAETTVAVVIVVAVVTAVVDTTAGGAGTTAAGAGTIAVVEARVVPGVVVANKPSLREHQATPRQWILQQWSS